MIHAEIEPGRSDCPRSWKPGVIASSPVPCGAGLGARSAGRDGSHSVTTEFGSDCLTGQVAVHSAEPESKP